MSKKNPTDYQRDPIPEPAGYVPKKNLSNFLYVSILDCQRRESWYKNKPGQVFKVHNKLSFEYFSREPSFMVVNNPPNKAPNCTNIHGIAIGDCEILKPGSEIEGCGYTPEYTMEQVIELIGHEFKLIKGDD
jgi:hypothetical protein